MKKLLQKIPKWIQILTFLAVFGIVRAPFEDDLRMRLVSNGILLPPPAKDALGQLNQSALMGTLGGLRSIVSSYLVLEAFDHFSLKEWEELPFGLPSHHRPRTSRRKSLAQRSLAHWNQCDCEHGGRRKDSRV